MEIAITLGIILIVLQVADIGLTLHALEVGLQEKNPIAVWAFRLIGVKVAMLLKLILVILITACLVSAQAIWGLGFLVLLYTFNNSWNLGGLVVNKGSGK